MGFKIRRKVREALSVDVTLHDGETSHTITLGFKRPSMSAYLATLPLIGRLSRRMNEMLEGLEADVDVDEDGLYQAESALLAFLESNLLSIKGIEDEQGAPLALDDLQEGDLDIIWETMGLEPLIRMHTRLGESLGLTAEEKKVSEDTSNPKEDRGKDASAELVERDST